jgi:trk system potassium uptake protein TrkA
VRIIVVGAGEVGFHIAQRLAFENKEVVVIDKHAETLRRVGELLDVQTVGGSGSSPSVLEEAGIARADILLAVTDSDETNLVACLAASLLAPGIVKLARIRSEEFGKYQSALSKDILHINLIINPEIEVVSTIERLMSVPGAVDIGEFADGRIKLAAIRVKTGSLLAGTPLPELRRKTGKEGLVIGAIIRMNRLIIPSGADRLEADDLVYVVCEDRELPRLLEISGHRPEPIKEVMIIGGGNIGLRLAQNLDKKPLHVKLVEKVPERCRFLAERLDHTIILQGDGSDQELLQEENIGAMDLVVSITGDEETNVLCSLLAKRLGAKRTFTRINKLAYMPLVEAIGLDHIVSPRLSAVDSILRYIRRGRVISALSLKGEEAEALEAVALETSDIVGKPLKAVRFPKGALLLAVLRGEEVIVPTGDTVILPHDRIVILSRRRTIPQVEKALTVKLEYF